MKLHVHCVFTIALSIYQSFTDTYTIAEAGEHGKYEFKVPFHYTSEVEASCSRTHAPDRALRLAQEVSSLASSLPLSPSSSVFVRCDEERLDIMKVSPNLSMKQDQLTILSLYVIYCITGIDNRSF